MDFHQLVDAKAMQIINPKGNIRHGMGGGGHLLPPGFLTVRAAAFARPGPSRWSGRRAARSGPHSVALR